MGFFHYRFSLWVVVCLAAAPATFAQALQGYTVKTIAGSGVAGFADGAGTAAQFNQPCGLAFDTAGNLYIGDSGNSRVRKMDTSGTVTSVAGNGTKGYFGDTGAATSGGIAYPCAVAVDRSNNIYIADAANQAIRKVTGTTLSTFAGGKQAGFGGDTGKATDAFLNNPSGVGVDATGNVYISDSFNNRVRKVTTDGIINTIAGSGGIGFAGDGGPAVQAYLQYPQPMILDSAGNLLFSDTYNHAIRKITPSGTITTIAGTGFNGFSGDGGPATKAMLNYPKGLALGADGVLYIADTFNARIRAVSPNGTISTIAGNGYFGEAGEGGNALDAIFKFPAGIAVDASGKVYVADTQNNKIKVLTPNPRPPTPNAPPSISPGGVSTAQSFGGSTTVAPGSWIEIYGSNFATVSRSWTALEFTGVNAPTTLEGTRVTIGGQSAFVSYISPGQINVQVPSTVGSGPQSVVVSTQGGTSAQFIVTVTPVQPGLFAPGGFRLANRQYVGALLPDGVTYILPPATVPSLTSRQAHPGETIVLYGVGFGAVRPESIAGQVVQNLNSLVTPLTVTFAGTPAVVTYAGLALGTVGLYQINVVVPAIPDSDAVPIVLTLGGQTLPQTLFTAVKR